MAAFLSEVGPGVVCLVYSVILTKGVQELAADMDMEGIVLINEYGYASQELINTMLVGRASTNVHDGDKDLGDNFILKGIHRQSDIGFLTYFEHFGHFQVGNYFKKPKMPIWIICSESHYSVMFSPNMDLINKSSLGAFDVVYYDELSR